MSDKPMLIFFGLETSGHSRRVEGLLAQVLQRRGNHATFKIHQVDCAARADLAQRFGVDDPPTIVVVDGGKIRARLEKPTGTAMIRSTLEPWLR